jgi:hypothetical protein
MFSSEIWISTNKPHTILFASTKLITTDEVTRIEGTFFKKVQETLTAGLGVPDPGPDPAAMNVREEISSFDSDAQLFTNTYRKKGYHRTGY